MNKENPLLSESVNSLMRKYAVPCIISLLVAALYNIVDQIFIANADYLGAFGNSANTVVYPLTVAALSIAVMIGDGACAFVSIALGKHDLSNAHKAVGNAVVMTLFSSLLITLLYLLFQTPILNAFGASVSEQTFLLSKEYFFYITLGIPFYMFGQSMNPLIRSDGSPKYAMASTLAGCFVNIVLDPIFIYPLHMGMKGAAIATVLGQIVTAALAFRYLLHMKSVHLQKESYLPDIKCTLESLHLGMTSFLSQISIVASMMAVQNMIMKYSAIDPIFSQPVYAAVPMAVLGIVMKFFQIVISISVGLAAGCIPVVGYNTGAKRNDRVKALFVLLLKWEALTGFAALLIVEGLPGALIRIFGAANESIYYTEFAIKCFRTYLCMLPVATVNKGTFIFLQSLGKANESTVISMIREILFGCGLPILLPLFLKLDGVLWSMPVSDILCFLIVAYFIVTTMKELDADLTYAG